MITRINISELNTIREAELVLKCGAYIKIGIATIIEINRIPLLYKHSLDILKDNKYGDILKQYHKTIVKLIEEFYKRTQECQNAKNNKDNKSEQ